MADAEEKVKKIQLESEKPLQKNNEGENDSASAQNNLPPSQAALDLSRLNKLLSRLAGSEFRIALHVGEEVSQLDDATLTAIAECYARLAREKWYENWTIESARDELVKNLKEDEDKINLISLVYRGDAVIGFCWAFIISANNPGNLATHFSSSKLNNKDNLDATRNWLAQAGNKEKLLSIRELGILKQYTKVRSPLLCAPVFSKALSFKCRYIFLRTPANSEALKLSLGIGFIPEHYFVVNQMLLMLGNLEHTVKDYEFRILDYFAGQLTAILDQDKVFEEIMHQKELGYAEKLHVMQDLSANIAHEMRTPLSGVRASMDGIQRYLPVLLEVYRKSIDANSGSVPGIRADHLGALERTPERIALMIDQANSVIDMLLMNLRDNTVDKGQFGIYSAKDCIEQALDRYPFKRGEREKIILDMDNDFYFLGLDNLFIYVMFNLIKNALFSINSALKGGISIQLKQGKGANEIFFRDGGEGIDKDNISHIFDGFFSTREEGAGVGLAFCRRTIKSFGGDICCDSEYGEFAEFTITLPAT